MIVADPAYALQLAVVDRLIKDPALIAFFGGEPRIYDTVPADTTGRITATFPYVSIGDVLVIEDEDDCAEGSEVHFPLHPWTRPPNAGLVVKQLGGLLRRAMKAPLFVPGHRVIVQGFEHAIYKREPDGLTRQGMLTWLYETEPL